MIIGDVIMEFTHHHPENFSERLEARRGEARRGEELDIGT